MLGSIAKGLGKGLGTAARYNYGTRAYIGDKLVSAEAKAGKALAKATFKKSEEGARFSNMYTGLEMRKASSALVLGGAAIYGASTYEFGSGQMAGLEGITGLSKPGEVSYGGTPGVFDADGVATKSKAPTLGASGDLVLGLHNNRKG